MLGYELQVTSRHVLENKKTLGHGKKGGETSKERGTISRKKALCLRTLLRAFRTNAEKNLNQRKKLNQCLRQQLSRCLVRLLVSKLESLKKETKT